VINRFKLAIHLLGFFLLSGILLMTTNSIVAQTDFRPGYAIKNSGDTLFGKIDYRGDLLMSRICRFENADLTISEYSPSDIIAFRFIDSKYYVSKTINNKSVFLKYLIKAKVSIYYMRDDNGDHYFLDKEDMELAEIPYEEVTKLEDDKQVFYQSTKHIGLLKYFMQDAPGFQRRIATIKKPNQQNLVKLAEDYQNSVCKDVKCIIYEKKLPVVGINFELVSGLTAYYKNKLEVGYSITDNGYDLNGGLILHFWMPRENEKFYFRTGILLSSFEMDSIHANYMKVPIGIEYLYPKGIIRPKFAFGFYLNRPHNQHLFTTVALMGGLKININKYLGIAIDYDIDFIPNNMAVIVPEKLFSQSILAGLYLSIK
jgi:hypothetical protein